MTTKTCLGVVLATIAVVSPAAEARDATTRNPYLAQAPSTGAPGPVHVHPGAQQQRTPGRTEVGPYARDLPHGAAAPTSDERPPIYTNLGTLSWPAGTANPEAQAYFDQGYRLAWGFNHAEAVRAFRAAQEIDPNCAMCFWGEAWALGPHINYPMDANAVPRALAVLDQGRRAAAQGAPEQAALIDALSRRYSTDPRMDRKALDQAYADAMEQVQARFPKDANIALLNADALMNLTPWDYWADAGRTPKGTTPRTLALIEGVLGVRSDMPIEANPDHPGAIHLYIHMVEASDQPERASPHAARLAALMPGTGHIVHMPSHIWYRLGKWRDSLDANRQAAAVDEAYVANGGASLLYSQAYYAHNVHFVLVSALMGGDGGTAIEAAGKLAGIVTDRAKQEVPWTLPIAAAPYIAHARFSDPETILRLPPPSEAFPLVRAHWHYARGEALVRLGKPTEALAEAAMIEAMANLPAITALPDAGVPAPVMLNIASRVITARVAQAQGEPDRAIAFFKEAAAMQDTLPYMEPPFWYYPVQQSLGAALLAQGRAADAAAAFREALKRSPNNGWAASGLYRAAEALGDTAGMTEARHLMEQSWFGGEAPTLSQL
ncbi:tetratricopeptide repeat protein [Acetobacteraceae bacterium AT-5844]|nr:tetratricopeptide repeat protein [Acetobacteraceae bacterium AT-5844]